MIDFKRRELRLKLLDEAVAGAADIADSSRINSALQQSQEQYLLETTKYILAYKAFVNKDFRAALALLEEAIKLDATFIAAHLLKGSVLIHMGDPEEAIRIIDYSIQNLNLTSYVAFYGNKGVALERMGRYDEAISCYLRAIEDDAAYERTYGNLLLALCKKGDWLNALSVSGQIREVFKEEPEFLNWIATQLLKSAEQTSKEGNPAISEKFVEETGKQLDLALTKEPENGAILYNLACFYSRMNQAPEAIETLKKSIETMDSDEKKKAYRDMASKDVDFANIRENPLFKEIVFSGES